MIRLSIGNSRMEKHWNLVEMELSELEAGSSAPRGLPRRWSSTGSWGKRSRMRLRMWVVLSLAH